MFFDPISTDMMANALKARDFGQAVSCAMRVTSSEELANSAITPESQYTLDELAKLLQDRLQAIATASMGQTYGEHIPVIMGAILQFLERWANGEFTSPSSEPEQQSSEETTSGS